MNKEEAVYSEDTVAVYLQNAYSDEPKEYYRLILDRIAASKGMDKGIAACDFGCATGEFIHHACQRFPDAHYVGYDVMENLVEKANELQPNIEYHHGSVLDPDLRETDSVDISFLLGVINIFDDCVPCLDNLIRWTKPGGTIYIFSAFNPYPIDVWIQWGDANSQERKAGWNIVSIETVSRYLNKKVGEENYNFIPFEMPFDIPYRPDDPGRSWTMKTEEGKRLLVNGLSIIGHFNLLEIRP